jgi:hypothetical protein
MPASANVFPGLHGDGLLCLHLDSSFSRAELLAALAPHHGFIGDLQIEADLPSAAGGHYWPEVYEALTSESISVSTDGRLVLQSTALAPVVVDLAFINLLLSFYTNVRLGQLILSRISVSGVSATTKYIFGTFCRRIASIDLISVVPFDSDSGLAWLYGYCSTVDNLRIHGCPGLSGGGPDLFDVAPLVGPNSNLKILAFCGGSNDKVYSVSRAFVAAMQNYHVDYSMQYLEELGDDDSGAMLVRQP